MIIVNTPHNPSGTIFSEADMLKLQELTKNTNIIVLSDEVYEHIQKVRHRAGLDIDSDLVSTWSLYSNNPNKPLTKNGMRSIIQQERMIELALEGHRYWDIKRWKLADDYFNLEIDQAGTKTAQGAVNVAGTLTVQSTDTPIYDIAATTTTVTGTSTIAGTLNINGSGVYDANGDFAASGAITMDGTARLQLSATGSGVSNLGTLDDAAGTVEYDGGTQNVLADTYYNLEIDQALPLILS